MTLAIFYLAIVAICLSVAALRAYQDALWRITELEDKEERRRRREKAARKTDEAPTEKEPIA